MYRLVNFVYLLLLLLISLPFLYFSLYLLLVVLPVAFLLIGALLWWKSRKLRQYWRQQARQSEIEPGATIIDAEYEILDTENKK